MAVIGGFTVTAGKYVCAIPLKLNVAQIDLTVIDVS